MAFVNCENFKELEQEVELLSKKVEENKFNAKDCNGNPITSETVLITCDQANQNINSLQNNLINPMRTDVNVLMDKTFNLEQKDGQHDNELANLSNRIAVIEGEGNVKQISVQSNTITVTYKDGRVENYSFDLPVPATEPNGKYLRGVHFNNYTNELSFDVYSDTEVPDEPLKVSLQDLIENQKRQAEQYVDEKIRALPKSKEYRELNPIFITRDNAIGLSINSDVLKLTKGTNETSNKLSVNFHNPKYAPFRHLHGSTEGSLDDFTYMQVEADASLVRSYEPYDENDISGRAGAKIPHLDRNFIGTTLINDVGDSVFSGNDADLAQIKQWLSEQYMSGVRRNPNKRVAMEHISYNTAKKQRLYLIDNSGNSHGLHAIYERIKISRWNGTAARPSYTTQWTPWVLIFSQDNNTKVSEPPVITASKGLQKIGNNIELKFNPDSLLGINRDGLLDTAESRATITTDVQALRPSLESPDPSKAKSHLLFLASFNEPFIYKTWEAKVTYPAPSDVTFRIHTGNNQSTVKLKAKENTTSPFKVTENEDGSLTLVIGRLARNITYQLPIDVTIDTTNKNNGDEIPITVTLDTQKTKGLPDSYEMHQTSTILIIRK